jgi:D-hexose-6-phosphate mutarotase
MKKFEIPGRVQVLPGAGGLTKVAVTSAVSTAEIYLHGAHLTAFQKNGEPPLLFLSRESLFASDKAIRGGVPLCFPWFGPRAGAGMHGFARTSEWELTETAVTPDGTVQLTLGLPEKVLIQAGWPAAVVKYIVTVGDTLDLELSVANGTDRDFVFESCLHTYFSVSDIAQVSITGLQGLEYMDKTDQFTRKPETAPAINIVSETDRVYLNATGTVKIRDAQWRRVISVEKTGSVSTVVWNPWIEKAKAMADLGDQEYREMVCVEAGNVGDGIITLPPGQNSSVKAILRSGPLK